MVVKPEPKTALFGEDSTLYDYAMKLNIGIKNNIIRIIMIIFIV
jgi:hypothetical protein